MSPHAMQLTVLEQNHGAAPCIHVGCHFGPVLESAGDLWGDSVNVAARRQGASERAQRLADARSRSVESPDTGAGRLRFVSKSAEALSFSMKGGAADASR
jgi:class 3 adenylate cyclase